MSLSVEKVCTLKWSEAVMSPETLSKKVDIVDSYKMSKQSLRIGAFSIKFEDI